MTGPPVKKESKKMQVKTSMQVEIARVLFILNIMITQHCIEYQVKKYCPTYVSAKWAF